MTLIDDYIADCQLRGIRYPKTAIYYIQDFATTCDLPNANRADLKRYLAILKGRNLKQSSVMKAYNHLSGFYEYLVDEELVTVNPVSSFRKRYLQTYKEQIAQDVRQLISIEDASRGKLIAALRDLWDLEKEYALRKAAVLRKYGRKKYD